MKGTVSEEFKSQAIVYLREDLLPRLRETVERLDEKELWWRPNESSNSAGNLLLHLNGNIHQWIVSGLGGEVDIRSRGQEFAARGGSSRAELMRQLDDTLLEATRVIESLGEEELLKSYRIQIYQVSGVQAILHVVEHFSHHVGQILFLAKLLKNEDLGFYANLD